MWSFIMTMDLFWFLLFDGYGYFGLFWFISLHLGFFAYVSSLFTHVFIMQYFPLLALIKKKVGNTKEEKHDKEMSIETWDMSNESKV